jgi:methylenetetrahydrofolate reductase (NADPH)
MRHQIHPVHFASMPSKDDFSILIEVVPPAGPVTDTILASLAPLNALEIHGFSVATNPVAKPRMSAMALCALIQQKTGLPATLHITTRDHNRLSLQSLLWGAKALGIETVLVASGDFVALKDRAGTTTVRDVDIFGLIEMARDSGLYTGVVFDPHPEIDGMDTALKRLEKKKIAGAQFVVTQPVYDQQTVQNLAAAINPIGLPVILGILPLRTAKHAEFLHHKVAGIAIPQAVRQKMHKATDSVAEGVANARLVLSAGRQHFAGVCIMPPFDHYEVLFDILSQPGFSF